MGLSYAGDKRLSQTEALTNMAVTLTVIDADGNIASSEARLSRLASWISISMEAPDMRTNLRIRLSLLLFALLAAWTVIPGCGGGSDIETDANVYQDARLKGAPEWVVTGRGKNSDLIYGVGTFSGVRDIGLATDTAMARARNQIVLNLQAEVRSLLESGQIQTDDGEAFDSVQEISNTIAQVGKMSVSGAMMESKWFSPSNDLWVLASINASQFGKQLEKMEHLSTRMREDIHQRVQENLGRMDERTLGR